MDYLQLTASEQKSPGQTLSDGAFERIQNAIVKGQIEPGSRISEQYLCTTFGIGRGPLREAIRRLEGRRLVVRIPHAGVRVVSLSFNELIELYHVREALEGMACRLAAQNMTDTEIAGLREVLSMHEQHSGLQANESYYQQEGDLDIHFLIIQGSKNRTLSELLCGDLYHLLRMYRYRFSTTPKRPQQAFAEHHRIIQAIADRDGELAEMLMRRHISASRRNIEQRMQETFHDKQDSRPTLS
jgi:DNA-binding GntR family transcriptional regulator